MGTLRIAGRARRGALPALAAAVLLVVGACATGSSSPGSSPAKTIRPADTAAVSTGPQSPVVGTVTAVDPPPAPSASPGKTAKPSKGATPAPSPSGPDVLGFTLLTTGGETLIFVIGELDHPEDFPPQSLYDRLSTEDPIRVFFTVDGTVLTATQIEDAG